MMHVSDSSLCTNVSHTCDCIHTTHMLFATNSDHDSWVAVHGPQAENYSFTSALPVQLLKVLAPSLMPLVDPKEAAMQVSRCGG